MAVWFLLRGELAGLEQLPFHMRVDLAPFPWTLGTVLFNSKLKLQFRKVLHNVSNPIQSSGLLTHLRAGHGLTHLKNEELAYNETSYCMWDHT